MRPRLAQREVALAGVALLAGVVALAVNGSLRPAHAGAAQPEGSYVALAGASGAAVIGRRTACGGVIRADTEGVAHPTLPCGARLFISFHGVTVLTQVVDRGPYGPGRELDLTDALAQRLGLTGIRLVRWSYARTG